MLSRPLVLVLVGAGCVAAAGIGAYVAVRQNTADVASPPAAAVPAERADAARPHGGGVAETEAVVADEREAPAIPAPLPKPQAAVPRPAPVRPPREQPREVTPAVSAPVDSAVPALEPPVTRVDPIVDTTPPVVGATVPPEPLEPPPPQFEELVVSADSVIGLQVEHSLSTETAQLEDRVEARVTRDVVVTGRVAVPAGTRVVGSVTLVERGGKIKERARLGVRFHTLVMADASRIAIQTDSIFREGEPPANESVAKIGGAAVGGAILGAIFGGAKGAVIGGATGAAGGTAATMAGERNPATLPAGATVTVRLTAPVTVTVER